MRKRWWNVWTGETERLAKTTFLGTHFGYVDQIALALADKQSGWWCDGKLTFEPTGKPKAPKLPRKTKRKQVNVVVEGESWFSEWGLKKARGYFKGRPVIVSDCSQYAAVTISRKSS